MLVGNIGISSRIGGIRAVIKSGELSGVFGLEGGLELGGVKGLLLLYPDENLF